MQVAHPSSGTLPSVDQAQELAQQLLGDQGTRLAHVLTAGQIAHVVGEQLADGAYLTDDEAQLLVVAATVHDIGYAPGVAHTGFHPYDGAVHLRALGWPSRLARLVANHSCALITAPTAIVPRVESEFPLESGLLPDTLTYSDMHSSPSGQVITAEARLADIARRHTGPLEMARAAQLRLAMARVGDALLLAQSQHWTGLGARGVGAVRHRVDPDLRAC